MPNPRHFLDRPVARILALILFAACFGLLAYIHRGAFTGPDGGDGAGGNEPRSACLAARFADIDSMIADGLITEAQAALFRNRARAFCHAEHPQ